MEAIILDIQEHPARTPHQVIRSFLASYSPESVNVSLWEMFSAYAASDKKGLLGEILEPLEIAHLLDSLANLVTAVHALQDYDETG